MAAALAPLADFLAHRHWMPVAVAVIAWLVSMTSDWSRFPVTVPDRWKPVVALVLSQAYAVLVAASDGTPLGTAALHGLETALVTMGGFDLLAKAVWPAPPPWLAWVRLLAFPKPAVDLPVPTPKNAS
jgi:hypothetical protein